MFFRKVPTVRYNELSKHDVIVDVREPSEYQRDHLPRAKNVPLSKIDNYQLNQKVYVICASGARSKRAVRMLRKNGVEAYNIQGGMLSVKR